MTNQHTGDARGRSPWQIAQDAEAGRMADRYERLTPAEEQHISEDEPCTDIAARLDRIETLVAQLAKKQTEQLLLLDELRKTLQNRVEEDAPPRGLSWRD